MLTVTGSIAAYKACEIVRTLKKNGDTVRVILTRGGEQFISPLSFSALGAEKVYTDKDEFGVDENGISVHISLSRWADCILVAPATADFIAKINAGIADSLPLTTILASKKPIFVAPCMNENMYLNAITQRNISGLKKIGMFVIEPEEGPLADFSAGKGRLPETEFIVDTVNNVLEQNKFFEGKRITVTCGATREFIDPVRFITNGSSGKMGTEIARAAKAMGAKVHLIYSDIKSEIPPVDSCSKVITTEEMYEEVKRHFDDTDILIMAAAPADFKPKQFEKSKLPKSKNLSLELEETIDILKNISKEKKKQIIVGFALQTEDLKENAMAKLKEKNMDVVVANLETNIGTDTGSVLLISKNGTNKKIDNMQKSDIAKELLLFVHEYIDEGGKNG
ncbi:MAG: bifunctional phosphopantothenoylcysteine decarboxylase/phosphopantothenate--cysteine ligase CoaBC [Caldisericaceae bacterium]